jgi:uncharacterized protein involved in exopolysaccharide biosynthesis
MDVTPVQRLKNAAFAWAIVGLFVLLFAGTVLVALLYLAADNNH